MHQIKSLFFILLTTSSSTSSSVEVICLPPTASYCSGSFSFLQRPSGALNDTKCKEVGFGTCHVLILEEVKLPLLTLRFPPGHFTYMVFRCPPQWTHDILLKNKGKTGVSWNHILNEKLLWCHKHLINP